MLRSDASASPVMPLYPPIPFAHDFFADQLTTGFKNVEAAFHLLLLQSHSSRLGSKFQTKYSTRTPLETPMCLWTVLWARNVPFPEEPPNWKFFGRGSYDVRWWGNPFESCSYVLPILPGFRVVCCVEKNCTNCLTPHRPDTIPHKGLATKYLEDTPS